MESHESACKYYDDVLNKDRSTVMTSNDEPTPMECVNEILDKIPEELWSRPDLKILDPCCGNGNFMVPIYFKVKDVLYFNDLNESRLENVRRMFGPRAKVTPKNVFEGRRELIIAAAAGSFGLALAPWFSREALA